MIRRFRKALFLYRHGAEMDRLFIEATAIFNRIVAERNVEQMEAYWQEHRVKAAKYKALKAKLDAI